MTEPGVEWAEVAPQTVIVASPDRFWVYRSDPALPFDPFGAPMIGPGSPATTRNLLDGALAAGLQQAGNSLPRPQQTLDGYIRQLFGFYHSSRVTPQFMAEAAARFAAAGRLELAGHVSQVAQEESGHDALVLADLEALGVPREAVVDSAPSPASAALIAYFSSLARAEDPIGCLGYAYALEAAAIAAFDRAYIEEVEALLPAWVTATRCLRVHSALGDDVDHVAESIQVIAGLPAAERSAVARTVYHCAAHYLAPRETPAATAV